MIPHWLIQYWVCLFIGWYGIQAVLRLIEHVYKGKWVLDYKWMHPFNPDPGGRKIK